jgi:hypothetical protein
MKFEDVIQQLETRISHVCHVQMRYRVLWIAGEPRVGKTFLSRTASQNRGWRYINFTLDPGFLDSLIGQEETYRPSDFLMHLQSWCAGTAEEIIIIDEIEPLLGLWDWEKQELFFRQVGRAKDLKKGIVIVTRLRTTQQLEKVVPGMDHVFEIGRGLEL